MAFKNSFEPLSAIAILAAISPTNTCGLMIVIVSLFFDGTPRPMLIAIALCALGAWALSFATLRRQEYAPQLAK